MSKLIKQTHKMLISLKFEFSVARIVRAGEASSEA